MSILNKDYEYIELLRGSYRIENTLDLIKETIIKEYVIFKRVI